MSQPPLNALRVFEAAARLGSFAAAAEALFVTQSAVSHQIRHLEDWLGAPLFDRSGRRPRLLPRGEALARDLTLALGGIDAACRRARDSAAANELVVAAIPSVAVCWLIPRLPGFRALHPDIALRVIYAHHGHAVDFGDVDLAFVFSDSPPRGPGFRAQGFLSGISVPVCSPRLLPDAADLPPAPADLPAMGLLHDADTAGWQLWLQRAGLPVPADLPGPVFQDFNLLRAAALSGQGVAICSLAMIATDLAEGALVRLSDIAVLEEFDYYLTISDAPVADEARLAARAAFIDWVLAERAASQPAEA
ncbi:LysR family transcriptional regulator [Paracoccus siganidrum]|uniref:LysR family transcriptional regulator n=1 Tax=Paracoccus siganidrum TaxID=1276757 RepID=A0A419A6Y3_9RHOB|nr:LysR family transcriptional regulator [Paracoccus siganidrum]RJL16361.1 LysR family transcriptional regulator [Paracoccus siganidrum]RMC39643.1 LysR family transcriptional regulator [Paracoccus siganidrum]